MNIPNSSDFCTRQLYAYAEHGWVQSVGHTGLGHFVYTKCIYGVNPLIFDKISEVMNYEKENEIKRRITTNSRSS